MSEKNKQDYEETIGLLVHSYNNFLAGMIGFNELAQLECQQTEVAEKLELSHESAMQAVDFGKQLLSAVGRLQVRLTPLSLQEILEDFCSVNQVELEWLDNCDDIQIKTDSDWFRRCLKLIVEFCRNFTGQNQISCRVSLKDDQVLVCLNNQTMSFSSKQQAMLFEPFYSSRTLLGSKDVGMAVVRGFAGQMKGSIEWNLEKGFAIALPLTYD